jgi:signal transduction histidine kinase
MKKVADIKNGNLILINEEEKKKLEIKVEMIEEAYNSLQDMLSEEECDSGICYYGLSDY